MGKRPCCDKQGLNKGAWSFNEDEILIDYIRTHGQGKWRDLPKKAGLKRCGKSCRLRWLNYLRPDIKRGNISMEEEDLIIRLHKLLGNRWSLIAGRLPGRTDNEIKNYWNTNLSKRLQANKVNDFGERHGNLEEIASMKISSKSKSNGPELNSKTLTDSHRHVIRTKAFRCKKVAIPWLQLQADHDHHQMVDKNIVPRLASETPTFSGLESFDTNFLNDLDINDIVFLDVELNSELCEPKGIKINEECGNKDAVDGENGLEGVSRFDLTKFDDQSSMDETITRFENIVPGLACDTPFSSGLNNSNTGFLNDFHIYDLYSDVVLHSELWESKAERLD